MTKLAHWASRITAEGLQVIGADICLRPTKTAIRRVLWVSYHAGVCYFVAMAAWVWQ